MVGKSTHLKVIPQKSTQNAVNLPLQTSDNTGVHFKSRINFANLGSFAKVSVPLQSIIP